MIKRTWLKRSIWTAIGCQQQSAKINLASEASTIYPIPVSEGGSLTEKFFDSLEAIIAEFNSRHGDIEWTDRDKVNKILFQEIPEQLQDDEDTIETLKNSDKQNAKISMDKKILDLMQDLMSRTPKCTKNL